MTLNNVTILFLYSASSVLCCPLLFLHLREESGLENTQNILTKLGLKWDEVDARVVRVCCDTVSSRSARLCAAALATLANRIRTNRGLDHLKTTVGVDGTVYKKHPKYENNVLGKTVNLEMGVFLHLTRII